LASAILRDTPRPIPELRAGFPDELSRLIQHCLEKNAAARFPSAREMIGELRGANAPNKPDSGAVRIEEGFWVAVLPFEYKGANANITALAEGLSEDIVTGLSRFSYLRVIARSSTLRYAHDAGDVRSIGKELGARYVMEGSLRPAGSTLRIAVQLVDANSGAHLWADTYDRAFRPEDIFAFLDGIVPRIVSTVADTYGVLPHTMSEALRGRDPKQLTPYEAVLRSFAHFPRLTAEDHASARAGLERAVQHAPGYADAWAMLSMLFREEYTHGLNERPDPIGRAFAAARRAVETAPSNHLAYHALASAQFFRREIQAFRNSADRAIALNPMDGFTAAYLGFLLAYAGDWKRGCALTAYARQLNPHHPGWYWTADFFDAYRKRDYRGALDIALKINMPMFWRVHIMLATAYGQIGEQRAAHNAVRELLAVRPGFAEKAREELAKWWDPELVEHLIDGLRKAGLAVV
jgi:TolB-like protein